MNRYLFVLLLSAVALVFGQTRISARKQARDFDLSEAANVRPIPVVSNLPSTCVQGEMVFKANAEAGRNLYACTGGNTWAAQSTTSATDPGFRMLRASPVSLTVADGCSLAAPCLARLGSIVYALVSPASLTLTSGDGRVFVYINRQGQLSAAPATAGSLILSCAGCQLESTTTGFPAGSIPLWTWNATGGQWDASGAVDQRAWLSGGQRLLAGPNITIAESASSITIGATNPALPSGAITANSSLRLAGAVPLSATESLFGLGNLLSGGSAAGTYFGMHAPASFGGNLAQWLVNNETRFLWSPNGTFSAQLPNAAITWMGNSSATAGAAFRLAIADASSSSSLSLGAGSRNFLVGNGLGKVAVGTVAPVPSTADLLIRDNTATTGDTQVQIQAGAGQQRDLLQFLEAAGGTATRVTSQAMLVLQPIGAQPTCSVTHRGAFWYTPEVNGVSDSLSVCRKAANDTYSWRALIP